MVGLRQSGAITLLSLGSLFALHNCLLVKRIKIREICC